jgi:endoglucanase
MNVPPQSTFKQRPQTKGFLIYDDFIGEGIFDASFPGTGTLDYYSEATPQIGSRCAYWTNVDQYNSIAFDFKPDLDLSLLESNSHVLEFWVRGNTPSAKFDVRFIDTKTSSTDHPWRMGKTIDNAIAQWDGEWHNVSIPLSDLQEGGSYDNAWFPAEGKYDWKAVDRFEIVAEHGALNGIDFWFDEIRISGEDVPYEEPVTALEFDEPFMNASVSPNPMKELVNIQFTIRKIENVKISIYSLTGQKIKTLIQQQLPAGKHQFVWEGDDDRGERKPSGLYLVEVRSQTKATMLKVLKAR